MRSKFSTTVDEDEERDEFDGWAIPLFFRLPAVTFTHSKYACKHHQVSMQFISLDPHRALFKSGG